MKTQINLAYGNSKPARVMLCHINLPQLNRLIDHRRSVVKFCLEDVMQNIDDEQAQELALYHLKELNRLQTLKRTLVALNNERVC